MKKQSYEEGEAIGEARGEARGKIKGEEKLARLVVELNAAAITPMIKNLFIIF